MNFVIVAPNFYPMKDAEAYCSTRFASALAKAGHTVEVITAWHPDDAYANSYPQLVHSKVKITRVGPCVRSVIKWPHIDWKWLTVMEENTDLITPYVDATRTALGRYDQPILVSRSYPWLAFYVGWYCRKSAHKWIAHFSDPMIDYKPFCRLAHLKLWSQKWWMRRAMRNAFAISITCKRVQRYFREQLGSCVDRAKFILTTHIGDFKFGKPRKLTEEQRSKGAGVIYHDGDIYCGRGLLIIDAVDRLNAEGVRCLFVQGRDVNAENRARLLASPYCKIAGRDASQDLRELAKCAQISFVADFDSAGLPYSPFLMSKFVYQLFTDKPIVVLSKLESEKHDYCVAYPEAGLFFAEIGDVDSLAAAIRRAIACNPATIDRKQIRKLFTEEVIGGKFLDALMSYKPCHVTTGA